MTLLTPSLLQILSEISQEDLPVQKTWRLNERHYGDLTGLNKAETAAKHGEAQVRAFPLYCSSRKNTI